MPTQPNKLVQVVRLAQEVTNQSIENAVIDTIRNELDDSEKATIYDLYDEGTISETVARKLLGDDNFEHAETLTESTEAILDKDASQYLAQE